MRQTWAMWQTAFTAHFQKSLKIYYSTRAVGRPALQNRTQLFLTSDETEHLAKIFMAGPALPSVIFREDMPRGRAGPETLSRFAETHWGV